MRKTLLLCCLFSWQLTVLIGQVDLSYYLPENNSYDSRIPTPKSILGHEIGDWHVSHDKLVNYMYAVADASDRVSITEYSRTYENRPLLLLTITAPNNQVRIDEIKANHLKITTPSANEVDIENQPAVVWLGHSVHGNEPSGANSSLVTLYHFAAAQGDAIEKLLNETVILLDPSINPDGLNRFSSWVNSHKGQNLVADPNNLEQNEAWPRGRTNHYWFDLNRDYIPLQLPESVGRIAKIQEWKPNLYTDHHEMGTNSTFFFQPGVPSRVHPLIPKENYSMTEKISGYFQEGMDNINSFYFSKENYDDYYPGRGPTYVDFNGGMAVLFEQASSRGHAQESDNGILKFPFTIRNQHRSAIASVKATHEMRVELLNYQRNYYADALKMASKDPVKAYVFGSDKDLAKSFHLAEIVKRHDIDIYEVKNEINAGGNSYLPESSFIIPMNQSQYRLIHGLFEIRNSFSDSLFYDVSAWTLPLAFNLEFEALDSKLYNKNLLGRAFKDQVFPKGEMVGGKSEYAYVFEVHGYYAHRAINRLLTAGARVKVGSKAFSNSAGKTFSEGSIMVPLSTQDIPLDKIHDIIETIVSHDAIDVYNFKDGGSASGPDLGSGSFTLLEKPEILIMAEGGMSGGDVGEAWHLLDTRFEMSPSLVSMSKFNSINLERYNTIILLDGRYSTITNGAKEKLKTWISKGGLVIASKGGTKWLADSKITNVTFTRPTVPERAVNNYSDYRNINGAQVIGGSIFKAKIDLGHPIAWGFYNKEVPMFKRGILIMNKSKNPFSNPLVYTSNSLWSGYVPEEKLPFIDNSAAVATSSVGRGMVISFTDNLNFRAFWYGTNKLFLNSIFFGKAINPGTAR